MFLKRVMSGSARMYTVDCSKRLVLRRKMHVHQVWCELVEHNSYLRAVGRKVVIGVCLSVCLCALFLSARYLKNRSMDHHQIWWVGAGGEPLEQVQFWC